MGKWTKVGDFSKLNWDNFFSVRYNYDTNNDNTGSLICYGIDISARYQNQDQDGPLSINVLLRCNSGDYSLFSPLIESDLLDKTNMKENSKPTGSIFGTRHGVDLIYFFQELSKIIPEFDNEILFEILAELNVKNESDKILDLIKQYGIDDILKIAVSAQEKQYYKIIWQLANYLYNTSMNIVSIKQIYDLFSAVSEGSPYYREANEKASELLLGHPELQEQLSSFDSEDGTSLEKSFKHLVIANRNNGGCADLLFHRLCGREGFIPLVNNVLDYPNTLVTLAGMIKKLEEKKNASTNVQLLGRSGLFSLDKSQDHTVSSDVPKNGLVRRHSFG